MDVARSCFAATKNVPGLGPRRGRYYFLGQGAKFLQHSMLGGHWFERPFQTGDWSTAPTPKPTWVDGSIPVGGTWPEIHCCQGLYPDFTATTAKLTVVRASDSAVSMVDADIIGQTGCAVGARFPTADLFKPIFANLGATEDNNAIASACVPGVGATMETFFDPSISDPDYIASTRGSSFSLPWPPTALCTTMASFRVDWFGTRP